MKYVLALLALAGLAVSIMALRVHNMDPSQAPPCTVSGHWDCGSVNHSRYAVFPPRMFGEDEHSGKIHIPVAAIGIAGYALMAVLALFGKVSWVRELALIGFMAAGTLTYLEAYVMETWCIFCVWSQGIVTVLLLTAIVAVWMDGKTWSKTYKWKGTPSR